MKQEDLIKSSFFSAKSADYDKTHDRRNDATFLGLELLAGMIHHFGFNSILDVGAGTGRKMRMLQERCPNVSAIGVEPVAGMREAGYAAGIEAGSLVDGTAEHLPFPDSSFDIVAEFAVLHHVSNPRAAISEMMRVARHGIFISDSNNFGQGSVAIRTIKQLLYHSRLWPIANWLKTKGKGYTVSDGDGVAYSFSPFYHLKLISTHFPHVYISSTCPSGPNPFRSAGDIAILALKSKL
ncbi:MAG TPA: class I SAM-dependent methyltransferase [Tepidisphaeraceae bacterium]|nr:class I SAM-dependent methyltransferase [Tepidisphaeraceae bacterium]